MKSSSLLRLLVASLALCVAGLAAVAQAPSVAAAAPPGAVTVSAPLAADVVAARGICGNWKGAVAGYGRWLTSKSECSVFGHTSTPANPAKLGYSWQIPPYSNGRICVQGLGYIWSSTQQKTIAKWYSLGCGTSGGGTVPWRGKPFKINGKTYYTGVAATPKVRAKVQPGFLGGAYSWKG